MLHVLSLRCTACKLTILCCFPLSLQMVYIAELAQPVCWQTLQAQPKGRPDILPTLMVRVSCKCSEQLLHTLLFFAGCPAALA